MEAIIDDKTLAGVWVAQETCLCVCVESKNCGERRKIRDGKERSLARRSGMGGARGLTHLTDLDSKSLPARGQLLISVSRVKCYPSVFCPSVCRSFIVFVGVCVQPGFIHYQVGLYISSVRYL